MVSIEDLRRVVLFGGLTDQMLEELAPMVQTESIGERQATGHLRTRQQGGPFLLTQTRQGVARGRACPDPYYLPQCHKAGVFFWLVRPSSIGDSHILCRVCRAL